MRLKSHIIAGLVGAAATAPFWQNPYQVALFFTSSILIDADHYLDYIWRNRGKNWSPKRMFKYYDHVSENKYDQRKLGFSIMHTVEIFLLIYLLMLYVSFDFFLPVIAGMAYHIIFDVVSMTYDKIPFVRPFSIAEYHFRKKQMHLKGKSVDDFYKDMFDKSGE